MQSEHQYSNLLYEYFIMRIRFRYYKRGDSLPTIDSLCREFSVSAQTVKIALKRLRAEGYIDMRNGRTTKVIFQQDEEQARQQILHYFSRRVKGFQDLYQSVGLCMMPLLLEGFCLTDDEDLAYLSSLADGGGTDTILHFFCFVLQKLNNPLAMNLYWETSAYWGLIFLEQDDSKNLSSVSRMHEEMKRCVGYAAKKDWSMLREQLQSFRRISVGNAIDLLAQNITPAPDEEQIPFVWRIYRERPQICYSLASYLLYEIYVGGFRDAEYLPSYEKMAAKYGFSVSTMRRTVKMLNQIGAARSINGVGTRIFGIGEACDPPDFKSPAIRRNLAFFVQASELFAWSCEPVMRDSLTAAAPGQRELLRGELERYARTGRYELSLWSCLLFIAQHGRLQGIREIYSRIYSLFLWGYPLKAAHPCSPKLDQYDSAFTNAMIRGLRENNTDLCVKALKTLVDQQFPMAEQFLLSHGFRQEELRLTSSIRLLINPLQL